MKKWRNGILVLITICMVLHTPLTIFAHNKSEHNKELEAVLLGEGYSKYKTDKIKETITYIEDASYLTIDQFSSSKDTPTGEEKFEELKSAGKISRFLKFESIDYNTEILGGNVTGKIHRAHTHQGWKYSSGLKKIDIFLKKRREILLSTLDKVFLFDDKKIGNGFITGYSDKCNALAGIIYYVHILGDYDEAKKKESIGKLTDLAGRNDGNNMISELIEYCETLFSSQKKSCIYKKLIKELKSIEKSASKLLKSEGGINTDEKFDEYHECAAEVMETLKDNIPSLLENEKFFKDVFYSN